MIHRLLRRRTDDARSEAIWLTVYSDLITNLLLVFLVLYALTTMGNQAQEQAFDSLRNIKQDATPSVGTVLTLENVAQLLRQEFSSTPDISITEDAGVTRIEFGERILFASGEADLKSSAGPVVRRVAQFLSLLPYTIVVEGHTDDVPLRNHRFYRDNYELSMARAMAVVRLLVDSGNIPAPQMAAAAYGPFRPRASNLTPSSRRLNRRVEIALFKDVPYAL